MDFRRLVTVALLLTLVMSTDSAPADQTETGRVSLREGLENQFPCSTGSCACSPKEGSSSHYQCKSVGSSTADCLDNKCVTEDEW
uniref:Ctr_Di2_2 conopeptide n=1 Tax=Conus tribblei TaxID=101761 RepID=A0A0K8TUK5_CONTD